MIRNLHNEKWKEIQFDEKIDEKEKYKISNYGRLINCKGDEEKYYKPSHINNYLVIPLKQKVNKKSTARYVHKLVAQHFISKESADCKFVIHLNYDKKDNRVENLKWATKREKEIHQFSNPIYKNRPKTITYSKLTEGRVKLIKRKINDPNRKTRMKMIAKQFGVSTMQLYRIKSGENWSHVTE
ncbi:HNH endonuclease [Urechidicola croceus]|uniref:HNH endonuclease n=1 Tax=Urechidicola croceus TaxID=1850246 RepID=A0A1D8P496_9FLAO|nr:HNH endonuclease [Urechidicola croceus]AOW19402.1 HNH endonuclease [Urechidicola croceus]